MIGPLVRKNFSLAMTSDPPASTLSDVSPLRRSDVVEHCGQFSLLNTSLTPRDAMVEDLQFIRTVLDVAAIEFLLVRSEGTGSRFRPVLAVDGHDRESVIAALAAASENEPLYSKPLHAESLRRPKRSSTRRRKASHPKPSATGRRAAVLVSSGTLSNDPRDRVFRLFRPRVSPSGGMRLGAANGVQLEFWSYRDDELVLPVENAMTRRILPADEALRTTAQRYGQSWPTLEGMWDDLAGDVLFPIDIVFSWVDGAELEWQRARAQRMASYVVGEGDGHEARFRQLDELKYALRSVNLFAPWLRNIYIVTDSPRPAWLAEHPRVTIVRSEAFFADPSVLPTHNSHAVESQLHNIPGLSEHFLYSNDDMFFGRVVDPELFFTSGGVSRFIEANTRIGLGRASTARSGFENAARVNRALLHDRFGQTITRHLEHAPAPLRVSVLRELEAEFPDDFSRTAASAFRSATDISVTNSLYHYYALLTGRAVTQTTARVKYVDTTMHSGLGKLKKLLRRRNYDLFCLNDGSLPELSPQERAQAIRSFLEDYFPIPAPWELGSEKNEPRRSSTPR